MGRLLITPVKFFRRSPTEKRLFMEAMFWLALSRLAILLVPFRRIAPFLGQTMMETPAETLSDSTVLIRISWAVRPAGRYTPWESKCLAQAVTAKMMLERRHFPTTSDVLNRKRALSFGQIVKLHHGLKIPYECLIDADRLRERSGFCERTRWALTLSFLWKTAGMFRFRSLRKGS